MANSAYSSARAMRRVSLGFALLALFCLWFADLDIASADPWRELRHMALGLLQPDVSSWSELLHGLAATLAFALQGVAAAAVAGFILALHYRWRWVRLCCAFLRSVHELFWALIFMQVFGLSSLTGVLALALPYAGTLAKIYGELYEESDPAPQDAIAYSRVGFLSRFVYTTLPLAWPGMVTYTRYRLECALRSSVVLGFIGLPTLGFYLDTALKQGQYAEGAALLYVLILVIATLRWWLKARLIPFYILAAVLWMPPVAVVDWSLFWQFFGSDIVPAPLRGLGSLTFVEWLSRLAQAQLLPGLLNTVIVGQIALVLTGVVALLTFPLNSTLFLPGWRRQFGDLLLIVLRTMPEILLSFIFLLLLGPSMVPAILALGLHNGAIIAHLVGGVSDGLALRDDAPRGLMRYCYDVLPRMYRQFLAFLFYRWEIIMRETAMLGILGIPTLGFHIDSAFEALYFDRAFILILATAVLTMTADQLAHALRNRLHLRTTPESL